MKKLYLLIASLFLASTAFGQLGGRGDLEIARRGGVSATNSPGNGTPQLFLTAVTNANGSITYYFAAPVATATNAQGPSATLTNLSNTSAITNVGNATVGIKTADQLFAPLYRVDTNELILGASTNLGGTWVSNNVNTLNSNRNQIGTSTATFSNMFSVAYQLPALQGASEAVAAGFIKIVNSNNTVYAIKAAAMVNLEETGAGSAVYINTAHTNITAKGLTIMDSLDYEVETISGTSPTVNFTNSPVKYLELTGNTIATFSELTVGRGGLVVVTNPASHTFSFAGAGKYLNQNTDPTPTTNGYTYYWIFRPTTTVTSIWVLGRELELAAADGIAFHTNGTQLTISNTLAGASGDFARVNQTDISDGFSLTNIAQSATAAGVTWTVVAGASPAPDLVSLALSAASVTGAGIVTANDQTFNGIKSFDDGAKSADGTDADPSISGINDADTGFVWLPPNNLRGVAGGPAGGIWSLTASLFSVNTNVSFDGTATVTRNITSTQGSLHATNAGLNTANITNSITYSAPTLVLSGNSTQYVGNFNQSMNIIDMTNAVHVTGMVQVAAANFGRPWILIGRNLTSSNNTVSVSPLFQRAGTNFAVIAAGKRFRLSIVNDGSGGVNETNMLSDIQPYDSP